MVACWLLSDNSVEPGLIWAARNISMNKPVSKNSMSETSRIRGRGDPARKMNREDPFELEYDKEAAANRQNEQLIVYIFVSFIIVLAWIMGAMDLTFIWVFMLIVLVFTVWWGKVMNLTERHIRQKEIIMHRKRALRQSETAEWLNFVINRW